MIKQMVRTPSPPGPLSLRARGRQCLDSLAPHPVKATFLLKRPWERGWGEGVLNHISSLLSIPSQICNTSEQCDAGREPCFLGGGSPSMHTALSCFTGAFLTGHPSLPMRNYGLRSLTLIYAWVGGVLRVESPGTWCRTKDARITSLFSFYSTGGAL